MRKSNITVARIAELCARLINRESQCSIVRIMGISPCSIGRAVSALRDHGVAVETASRPSIDVEKEARLHNLFRSTRLSNRTIVTDTGIPLETVNKSRRRYNAALIKAGEELPKCDCGQQLHHSRLCWARHRQNLKNRGVRSVATLEPFEQENMRRRLLAGATMRSEAERANLPKPAIGSFIRNFTPEERRQRDDSFVIASARRRSARLSKAIARPRAVKPMADPLYAQISHAVPRGIDSALRDDMISQAYLEVLEGRLDPKKLAAGVRKVRGRVFQAFANPWGNKSIDIANVDGRPGSWADNIPDERALEAFNLIA